MLLKMHCHLMFHSESCCRCRRSIAMADSNNDIVGIALTAAAELGPEHRVRLGRLVDMTGRALKLNKPRDARLADLVRTREEIRDAVFIADTFIRALANNAQKEVRDKLLTQFEAWFNFVLEAQEDITEDMEAARLEDERRAREREEKKSRGGQREREVQNYLMPVIRGIIASLL